MYLIGGCCGVLPATSSAGEIQRWCEGFGDHSGCGDVSNCFVRNEVIWRALVMVFHH